MAVVEDDDERDVAVGVLGKFLLVALVIGLVLGLVTLAGVKLLGVDGGDDAAGGSSRPSAQPSDLPSVALSVSPSGLPTADTPSSTPTLLGALTLAANPPQAPALAKVYLTGTYAGKDGARLQVQRLENGVWAQFADVTVTVAGGAFSTYVMTSRTGANQFRVLDTSDGTASAPATVTIG